MALCNRRRARLPRIQRSLRMQFPIRAKPRDVYFDAAIATAGSYFFEREWSAKYSSKRWYPVGPLLPLSCSPRSIAALSLRHSLATDESCESAESIPLPCDRLPWDVPSLVPTYTRAKSAVPISAISMIAPIIRTSCIAASQDNGWSTRTQCASMSNYIWLARNARTGNTQRRAALEICGRIHASRIHSRLISDSKRLPTRRPAALYLSRQRAVAQHLPRR